MFCRCKNEKPIVIYQGDDTDFIGNPRVYLELETDLDLDGVTAKFEFLGVEKTFDVIPETKLLAVEFTKEETKTFPVGNAFASLKLTDSEGRVRTVSSDIKIFVTDNVDIAYNITDDNIINLSVKASYSWDEITDKPNVDSYICVTHAELVGLRNEGKLYPGVQYRITDYVATTSQENTSSANHPFDIIVTANSSTTLSEKARAIQHEGDTYFSSANLSAWQVWYALDNDAARFAWADASGHGIVYRLIDEWGNDVPYDFKGIMFGDSYTFNRGGWPFNQSDVDDSLNGNCFLNVVKGDTRQGTLRFNNFKFSCYCITLGVSCVDNMFYACNNITLGYGCQNCNLDRCGMVRIGSRCVNISAEYIDIGVSNIAVGDGCYDIYIGGDNITIGKACNNISIGSNSGSIFFNNTCSHISLGDTSYNITFGTKCSYIKLGNNNDLYHGSHNIRFDDGVVNVSFSGLPSGEQLQNFEVKSGVYGKNIVATYENKLWRDYHTTIAPTGSYNLFV